MSHVSNNTDKINAWAGDVNTTADDYDTLVSRLYALVDMFANSEDFKGTVSKEIENNVLNQRKMFDSYSGTFREASGYMKKVGMKIANDTEELIARAKSGNVM